MKLENLPAITFAQSDPRMLEIQILATVENILGRKLKRADPLRLFLRAVEALIIQQRVLIDETAKQGLLAYATGNNLDHLGVLVGITRLKSSAATVTLKFTVDDTREKATVIPAGTRVTSGDGIMFATNETAIINSPATSVIALATCTICGTAGNGYMPGELKQMVDVSPFVANVSNITMSNGGSDSESDASFRERIYEAPEHFSVAGPTGSYTFFTKSANSAIVDVSVESPEPGDVLVKPLLENGVLPSTEILNQVFETLNNSKIRPLTDRLSVEAPTLIQYDIDVSYWIEQDDAALTTNIQIAVTKALDEYIVWQCQRLGRDINPTELYYRLRAAGVKRAEIRSPVYMRIDGSQVAVLKEKNIRFEGLEDD